MTNKVNNLYYTYIFDIRLRNAKAAIEEIKAAGFDVFYFGKYEVLAFLYDDEENEYRYMCKTHEIRRILMKYGIDRILISTDDLEL
jgi:hypothetical protein